jgi:cytochrome c5
MLINPIPHSNIFLIIKKLCKFTIKMDNYVGNSFRSIPKYLLMKKVSVVFLLGLFLAACGGNNQKDSSSSTKDSATGTAATEESGNPSYDPQRGEGKFKDVEVGAFNATLAASGKSVYNPKCQSCHKLTDEKLVGPGWKGVTQKHPAAWILNFITNPDAMLDKDPELKNQLEICMVRMPNQNLTDDDAKAVYEFMRQNDGAK